MKKDLQRYYKTIKIEEWLYTKATPDYLEIVNVKTGEKRVVRW